MLRCCKEMLRSSLFYNIAAVHKYYPVSHLPCKAHFMGHTDHGDIFVRKLDHNI